MLPDIRHYLLNASVPWLTEKLTVLMRDDASGERLWSHQVDTYWLRVDLIGLAWLTVVAATLHRKGGRCREVAAL
ncbi:MULTISPECIES: hypothetical protein [Pseudomonas]|uniref:Uncharacterized protein n=1 Tax=Pseudomonas piscis TaxID=2614538 RepID=A0ABY9NCR4_9PSED|nr:MULTISPECIES: hypothetical protein [Pseudomonas]WMN16306.1 hypothetical protein QL104_23590 [Pseudomonas piscis]